MKEFLLIRIADTLLSGLFTHSVTQRVALGNWNIPGHRYVIALEKELASSGDVLDMIMNTWEQSSPEENHDSHLDLKKQVMPG